MNWIRIDDSTYAAEIPGAGCFVRFFGSANATFTPGVTIRTTKIKHRTTHALVAAPFSSTHISFTTDTATSKVDWVGDAGKKLDRLLTKKGLNPKGPDVSVTTLSTPYRGKAKVNRKKFKKTAFSSKL